MADDPLFGREKELLRDLGNGVGYLLRKHAELLSETQSLREERRLLLEKERQSAERIQDLETQLAFGGDAPADSPAVLRIRDEVDALIAEVDRCLETLERSVK